MDTGFVRRKVHCWCEQQVYCLNVTVSCVAGCVFVAAACSEELRRKGAAEGNSRRHRSTQSEEEEEGAEGEIRSRPEAGKQVDVMNPRSCPVRMSFHFFSFLLILFPSLPPVISSLHQYVILYITSSLSILVLFADFRESSLQNADEDELGDKPAKKKRKAPEPDEERNDVEQWVLKRQKLKARKVEEVMKRKRTVFVGNLPVGCTKKVQREFKGSITTKNLSRSSYLFFPH